MLTTLQSKFIDAFKQYEAEKKGKQKRYSENVSMNQADFKSAHHEQQQTYNSLFT